MLFGQGCFWFTAVSPTQVVLATQQALSKQILVKGMIESHGLHMKELCALAFVELGSVALKFCFSRE